jgi:long-chain acyl-CoA synthetase
MNLSLMIQAIARHSPGLPALTCETTQLTYAAFEEQAARIGGALLSRHGLKRGSRIGIAMENCAEILPVIYGAWRAGMTVVPMNSKLHPREMAWILENSEARLCVATPELSEKMSDTAGVTWPTTIVTGTRDYKALLAADGINGVPGDPDDVAWLFYTSGTTGRPKGAQLTHRNLLVMVYAYCSDVEPVGPGDTCLHAAPLSHGSGMWALVYLSRGGHNVVLPGSFDPDRVYDAIAGYPNVSMFAAPTMIVRMINAPRASTADTRNLRTISYGGAPMYVADTKRALDLLGPKLHQLYGQGEAPMTITGLSKAMHADRQHPDWESRLGSAGVAITGVAFKVVGEDGTELPLGEVGEIITRSDCVMKGYWNNPEANAKALRDGWLWTGDLGSVDAKGFLTIKDRSKDMIISGGSNIYPREIEEVLLTHPAVLECAVVSRPHPEWGEEVIAYAVARPGQSVTPQMLDQTCLDNIARYKRPRGYRIVEALPKNNYGKVLKTELRAWLMKEPA